MADGAEHAKVVEAAGVIGLATLLSRILGFARDMVLARLFGAAPAADAFFIAYRIPNLLRELFAEGSMSAAFIPVFSEYLAQRTKRDAWELASAAFTTLLTILTAVCVLGIFASPWIVRLIAPGFSGDAEQQALTTLLTRIMFPYLLFIGLAALAMGVLNSVRSFAAPAFSPVLFNIAIIAAAFLLAPLFAEPILAVAVGVVIGRVCPRLHTQAAKGELDALWGTLGFGLRLIFFMIAPAMVGLILLRVPIVHLFFEHGRFTAADTQGTAAAVLAYAVGLWAFAGVRIVVSAFYSLQDTRTPVLVAAVALAANIALSLLLIGPIRHTGLELATALSAI